MRYARCWCKPPGSEACFQRTNDQRAEDKLASLIRLGPIVRDTASVDHADESPKVVHKPRSWHSILQHYRKRSRQPADESASTSTCARCATRSSRAHQPPRLRPSVTTGHVYCEAAHRRVARGDRARVGGRHHTTVLHAINKIEAMRRTDEASNRTITRLMDAFAAQT